MRMVKTLRISSLTKEPLSKREKDGGGGRRSVCWAFHICLVESEGSVFVCVDPQAYFNSILLCPAL